MRSLAQPLHPVFFEDLGLIVKHGVDVTTSEAVALWAIKKVIGDGVLVLEIYALRILQREGEYCEVVIYMQFVQGPMLDQK